MVAPALNDFEFQFRDDGITMNTQVTSRFIDVLKVSGLDTPDVRSTVEEYSTDHGGYADVRYFRQRTITIEGECFGSVADLEDYLDDWKQNFFPTSAALPFYLKLPGVTQRLAYAKSLGFKYDVDTLWRQGWSPFQVQLIAEDPRIYTSTPQSVSTGLPTAEVGRAYNRTYNMSYGSTSTGGTVNLTNDGTFVDGAPAIITITGDVVNPRIELLQTGQYLDFNLTIVNGSTLTIDLLNRSVTLDGASRRLFLTADSEWFKIPQGSSQINFRADSYAANALMAVTFRPAWV